MARRVAVIVETREWGGLEMHTVDLVQTLNASGYDAYVACIGDRTIEQFKNATDVSIPLVKVTPPSRRSVSGWLKAFWRLSANAVILQKGTLHTGSLSLDIALRLRFRSFVSVEHLEPPPIPEKTSGRYLGGLLPGLALWWYRLKLRGHLRCYAPRTIVCVSDSVRRGLAHRYNFPESKLVTVRNGVNLNRFRIDADARRRRRREWGIPQDAFVFGSVRRFVREKGLDIAIDAFASIHGTPARPTYLVLVGEGPEETALRQQAKCLGLADRVIFHGFTKQPWTVYPAFDVFVIPSRIEALGVVVVEALACGCSVIGTRVGGIPEMLESSLGTLVPADNVSLLAAAMNEAATRAVGISTDAEPNVRRHLALRFNADRQFREIGQLLDRRRRMGWGEV